MSGINNGYNLGSDVFYSGTVAGAVEAALRDVPAIAVSLERQAPQGLADGFSHAAAFVRALAAEAISRGPGAIPAASLLSVNLPRGEVTGFQVTFLGRRVYRDQVDVRQDLRRLRSQVAPTDGASEVSCAPRSTALDRGDRAVEEVFGCRR